MHMIQHVNKDGTPGTFDIELEPVEVEKLVLMLDDAIPVLVGEEEEIAVKLRTAIVDQRRESV